MCMNLFDYIQSMKNSDNMVIGIAGLAVLALFLLVIVLKMLGGMRRGAWRQIIRTGMTLAAAVVSYFIATGLSNSIIGSLNIDNIEDLIVNVDSYAPGAGEVITSIINQIGKESLQEYLNFISIK